VEPFAGNTAPAVPLAAMLSDPDAVLLVLPADDIIVSEKAFLGRSSMGCSISSRWFTSDLRGCHR